jgi:ferredoxin
LRYSDATLFYMTGTGNSFRAATWMAQSLRNAGIAADVIQVQEATRPCGEERGGVKSMLGIVFPTHGFTAPWGIMRFAAGLPRGGGRHALVVPTRAGMRVGGVYTPGMEGTAGYLIALILLLKGYRVRGVVGLDMPSNWMSLHSGLKAESVAGIISRAEARTGRVIATLLEGGRLFRPGSWVQLLFGLALLPVSAGYLLVGRFFFAKLFFANLRCNGCGICGAHCPNQAIRMLGRTRARPYWTFDCESCMRCMGYCPEQAIEAGHSLGVILYYASIVPVSVFLFDELGGSLPWLAGKGDTWIGWLVQYPYTLLSFYLAYLLIHRLIRIPLFNRLFTYTTLTQFYRRYREPGTKLRDIEISQKGDVQ